MALIPNRDKPVKGFVGTWANMESANSVTGIAEASFAAATPVTQGSADDGVVALTGGNRFAGIALANVDMIGAPDDGTPTFSVGEKLGVADMGAVFVTAGPGVSAGLNPFYDPSTGRYAGTSATGRLPLPGCEFDESAADGEVVALRIRLVPGAADVEAVTGG